MGNIDSKQQAAAERWLKSRREPKPSNEPSRDHDYAPDIEKDSAPERHRGGPEDDLEL